MQALHRLTGDAQTFVEKVWARSVHLHRTDPAQLVGLLSLDDADALLTGSAIRTPAVRVAKDGTVLPQSSYTRAGASIAGQPLTGLVDPRRILGLFDDGATIVFQGLHRYWPPLTELVAALEAELGHPCQANAYLTPPGSQGFALHSDSHDVFVFQTAGTKRWEIHPLGDDGRRYEQQVLCEPGLSMYLPTGTPHAARAQETVSLHVTIGINQLTWRTLVQQTVAPALAEVADEHLPAGYLDDPTLLATELADRLGALADRIRALDPTAAADAHRTRFLTGRNSRLRGGLRDLLAVRSLTGTTRLRRRPGSICVFTEGRTDDRLTVLLGDRSLTVPARLRASLEQIRDAPADGFVPDELPLDEQSRLVLCRRLVREGLLEVVG